MAEALAKAMGGDEPAVLERLPSGLLIGGEWRPAAHGATFEVEDPATGATLARVADAAPADAMSDAPSVVGPLMEDPRLRKVSFTGSTAVGRVLVQQSATNLLRTSMELGGNAPFIVFEDADVDAAVDGAMLAKMRNGGEACTEANRFYVHEDVADRFAERLAERMGAVTVGCGVEPGVELGPLIDETQRSKVAQLVADARDRGAELLTGGEPLDGPGSFFAPTVLDRTPPGAALLREEIFGPVAPIVRFSGEEEAIAAANDTEYGLIAYVYTGDLARGLRVMNRLETGMVALNRGIVSNAAAPFGGVKASGLGREGGPEGIGEYLETRYASFSLEEGASR